MASARVQPPMMEEGEVISDEVEVVSAETTEDTGEAIDANDTDEAAPAEMAEEPAASPTTRAKRIRSNQALLLGAFGCTGALGDGGNLVVGDTGGGPRQASRAVPNRHFSATAAMAFIAVPDNLGPSGKSEPVSSVEREPAAMASGRGART